MAYEKIAPLEVNGAFYSQYITRSEQLLQNRVFIIIGLISCIVLVSIFWCSSVYGDLKISAGMAIVLGILMLASGVGLFSSITVLVSNRVTGRRLRLKGVLIRGISMEYGVMDLSWKMGESLMKDRKLSIESARWKRVGKSYGSDPLEVAVIASLASVYSDRLVLKEINFVRSETEYHTVGFADQVNRQIGDTFCVAVEGKLIQPKIETNEERQFSSMLIIKQVHLLDELLKRKLNNTRLKRRVIFGTRRGVAILGHDSWAQEGINRIKRMIERGDYGDPNFAEALKQLRVNHGWFVPEK